MQYLGMYIAYGSFFLIVVIVFLVAYSLRLRCPECRGEVKDVERKIAIRPTKMHPGLERTEYRCVSCTHSFSKKKILPRLSAWVTADGAEKVSSEPVKFDRTKTTGLGAGYGRMAKQMGSNYRMFGGGKSCRRGK